MLCCGAGSRAAGLSSAAEAPVLHHVSSARFLACPGGSKLTARASLGGLWGPPNNITVGPAVSGPLPLSLSLGFHDVQLPKQNAF